MASFIGSAGHGDDRRRWVLLVITLVWGLRLALHMAVRSRGKGEDPRYAKMLEGRGEAATVLMVYGLQGVIAFIVAMPVVVGSLIDAPMGVLAYVGLLVGSSASPSSRSATVSSPRTRPIPIAGP